MATLFATSASTPITLQSKVCWRRLENGKRPQQKTMESFKLASLIIAEQQKFSVQLPSQ